MFTLEEKAIAAKSAEIAMLGMNKLGFELTWSEKIALKFYYLCMEKIDGPDQFIDPVELFLTDYFGLSFWEYGRVVVDVYELQQLGKPPQTFGLGLNGDKRFIEYCRRNVDRWREERNLI